MSSIYNKSALFFRNQLFWIFAGKHVSKSISNLKEVIAASASDHYSLIIYKPE